MKKWLGLLTIAAVGGSLLLWIWSWLHLPGQIGVLLRGYWNDKEANAIYLLRPMKVGGARWRRLTSDDLYAIEPIAWSPDGRQVAFRCADQIVDWPDEGRCRVLRRGMQYWEVCGSDVSEWPYGICLADVRKGNVQRIVNEAGTDDIGSSPKPLGDALIDQITWSLDGRYVVFLSRDETWHYFDIVTGSTGLWSEARSVQNNDYWYVQRPDLHVPGAANIQSIFDNKGRCYNIEHVGARGVASPDERFLVWITIGGESDPWCMIGFDTETERLMRFDRTQGYWFEDLAWLPYP